jgi:2'-5' RNA ligase
MTDQPPRPARRKRLKGPKFTKERPPETSVDTSMRLFLAVPIPPDVIDLVERVTTSLKTEEWPIRWTSPGNAHITLHFLGEIEPERAMLLQMSLAPVVSEHDAFQLRTADLGVFPNMKRPRILWLGLYGPAHRLHTLRDAIGQTLTSLDFQLDEREFHPHITLGRLRNTQNTRIRDLPAKIRARFERASETGEVTHKAPIPIPVTEVHLVQSHLGKDGPRYEVLERYPLNEPEA